jgi:hypothetical protein
MARLPLADGRRRHPAPARSTARNIPIRRRPRDGDATRKTGIASRYAGDIGIGSDPTLCLDD